MICEDDDITLECPEGQEIQIKRTTYGRQNKRECPSRNTEENKVKCNTNGKSENNKKIENMDLQLCSITQVLLVNRLHFRCQCSEASV